MDLEFLEARKKAWEEEIQQEISFAKNKAKIGQRLKTLFDRKEGQYFIGRTEAD